MYTGNGVFCLNEFPKDSFLLEYSGKQVSAKEGDILLEQHIENKEGSYVYFFSHKGKTLR